MNKRIVGLLLASTLLCSSCAKTRGVSLGSTSDEDDIEVDAGEGDGDDDDDPFHDERDHHDDDDDDDRPFWLEPLGAAAYTPRNSGPSR